MRKILQVKGDRFILQLRVEFRAQGQPGKKVVDEK